MSRKLYTQKDVEEDDFNSLDHYKEKIQTEDREFIILELGKIEYGTEYFYCAEFGEVGLKEDSECGISCKKYSPRNGKSGRCKYNHNCYTTTSEVYRLTRDGKLTKENT